MRTLFFCFRPVSVARELVGKALPQGSQSTGSSIKVRPAWRRDWITTRARPRVHTRPSSSPLVAQSSFVRRSSAVRRQSFVNAERLCSLDHVSGRSGCPTQRAWRTRIVAGADAVRAQTRGTLRARMWSQDADAGTRTSRPREASRAALGRLTVAAADAAGIGAHATYPPARAGAYAPDPTLSSRVIPSYWHRARRDLGPVMGPFALAGPPSPLTPLDLYSAFSLWLASRGTGRLAGSQWLPVPICLAGARDVTDADGLRTDET
ncbi:hypothetical protein HETIRDRAFT_101979 [Heterobasidion irregulare TC 32-1]|uniref:Uncharacterized protein n=1 Tax=Heterobasidion irregulare (strain TC 32-1) TaxID=747525 RepID=W4K775_HETIT|nr:uncharacterized protein HETIRDRAFT_101979 [Heterobasidion irregulare TC 32-1]ETW80901.1 hypothetical protein HETIRDRAFT_101979 [Heterobasidion irregulare TC 32-1]